VAIALAVGDWKNGKILTKKVPKFLIKAIYSENFLQNIKLLSFW